MKRGEPVLGCQVRSRSPLIAEMLGYCGLDYVFIEGEHFVHNIETVENQIRAIQVAGAVPIVRIPSHEDGLILQVIEAGVMGVIFPHIDTKKQALHAIREVKYPPVGNRGFGDSARASKFGFLPTEQFLDYVNENVMVIGMIESREGIRNLDEILSTGIDVLRIGAKGLSLDMGYGGVVTPEVKETVKEVCRRIRSAAVCSRWAPTWPASSRRWSASARALTHSSKPTSLRSERRFRRSSLVLSHFSYRGHVRGRTGLAACQRL